MPHVLYPKKQKDLINFIKWRSLRKTDFPFQFSSIKGDALLGFCKSSVFL